MAETPTVAALVAQIQALPPPPRDGGEVRRLVVRPARGERRSLAGVRLTVVGGVEGDRWAVQRQRPLIGGRYDQRQVTAIRADIAIVLAGAQDPMWTGDNLHLWLDTSTENLPSGSLLGLGGTAVAEVLAKPHTGCRRFRDRFGEAAGRVGSAGALRGWRVRGVLLRVVADGWVDVGDAIGVLRRGLG